MIPILIVVSIKDKECFDSCLGSSLSSIGVEYKIIKTDSNLPFTMSMNSIIEQRKTLEDVKYIFFCHQDVRFQENGGKEIVEMCDGLENFGYGGFECMSMDTPPLHFNFTNEIQITKPMIAETCDSAVAIIPSCLFLEQQFDTSFEWYPYLRTMRCGLDL